jgi:hypothetical protein
MKRARMISSVTLMVCAFLALIAGINAANPKWGPLDAMRLTFPLLRGGSTSVYDPHLNTLILFAGYSSDDSLRNPRLNDVWVLTNANGLGGASTWSQLITSRPLPPVRYKHSAVYDVANNRMIIYGGCGSPYSQQGCSILNDVWVLSNANGLDSTPPTWTQLFPISAPPPRQGHQAVYDPKTNSMIVWAGHDYYQNECGPVTYSDVWVLSNANGLGGTPNWTPLSPIGGPPAGRYFSTAVYDSLNNIMVVFGGLGMVGTTSTCQPTNAVWALSHANGTGGTPKWSNLIPQDATGSPANRLNHAAVYQPSSNTITSSNTMIIFGGSDINRMFLGDTWVLSHANGLGGPPVWKQLTNLTGPAPSARWNSGGIDTMHNLMIMFGGVGDGVESGAHVPLWSTWVLSDPDGL